MNSDEPGNLVSSLTLVLWMDCLAVGLYGLWVGNPLPPVAALPLPPVQAVTLNVEVTRNHVAPSDAATPRPNQPVTPPALPPVLQLPAAPALKDLAVITIPAPKAKPMQPESQPIQSRAAPVTRPSLAVEQLTYGQGEGEQPSPEYPIEAAEAGQQGVVVVRFIVGEDGLVQQATVTSPCRWPLLNRAAQTAIRQTWRFKPGPQRAYQVTIEFRLTGH
jgi:periplasmic protein TonB